MSTEEKIIHIVADISSNNIGKGVFISQVVEWANVLHQKNKDVEIILLLIVTNEGQKTTALKTVVDIEQKYSLKITPFFQFPFLRLKQLIILKYFFLRQITLYLDSLPNKKIIIHGRAFAGGWFARQLKKRINNGKTVMAIYDIRATVNEFLYLSTSSVLSYIAAYAQFFHWKKVEQHNVANADYIFCVTDSMKQFIAAAYKAPEERFKVIPCAVDTNLFSFSQSRRDIIRKEMNIKDEYVVIYSGGFVKWTVPDLLFSFFSQLLEKRKDIIFLVLSYDLEAAQHYLQKYNIAPAYGRILSVNNDRVSDYLCAADIALLIRERNIVNKVASPIKFAEYIACGLPVLISEGIGDYSEYVKKHNIGGVMEINTFAEYYKVFSTIIRSYENKTYNREALSRRNRDAFSKQNYSNKIIEIYESIK